MAYTTINDPSEYFNTLLWTGNGSTRSITGLGFSPDLVWIKDRGAGSSHVLYDTIRGAQKQVSSDNQNAELTREGVTAFDSDGFSLGTYANVNESNLNFVGWSWRGSDSNAVSNTNGSITSTVSANTTAGFSIVTYTGNGTNNATVGHGLGKTPKIYIVKRRDASANWVFFTTAIDGTLDYLFLNDTAPAGNLTQNLPTSSVFSLTAGSDNNASGGTFVSYVFAEIQGYSKFGTYTGNGNADGTFVYTGFRPSWLLVKDSSAAENWMMYDNKRDPFNEVDANLKANTSGAETDFDVMDFVSNGFKIRQSSGDTNNNGNKYIYMAFAEHPFVSSNGVPVTAR
jgi:hypothetical protein